VLVVSPPNCVHHRFTRLRRPLILFLCSSFCLFADSFGRPLPHLSFYPVVFCFFTLFPFFCPSSSPGHVLVFPFLHPSLAPVFSSSGSRFFMARNPRDFVCDAGARARICHFPFTRTVSFRAAHSVFVPFLCLYWLLFGPTLFPFEASHVCVVR